MNTAGVQAATRTPGSAKGWVWALIGTTTLLALAVFATRSWHGRHVPALPDLATRAPALTEVLRKADRTARSMFHAEDGLAELGRLYHVNGWENEAAACWNQLIQAQPDEGRWPYYLSDLRRASGDDAGMVAALKLTLLRSPTYPAAWLRWADFSFKNGLLDDAHTAYSRRLELVPGDPYARLGLARIALQRDAHDQGKQALEELVRDVPGFPSAHNVYAELLARDGDARGAMRHRWLGTVAERFREAEDPWMLELRSRCYDVYQLLVWGAQEVQTKQPARGRELYERALELAPNDPRPYIELGQFHLNNSEPAKTKELLERGMTLVPFSEALHVRLSTAYRMLGDPAHALEIDQRGLAKLPDSVELLNSRGQSHAALGQFPEAFDSFRAALRRSPNAPSPQINLGLAQLKAGQRTEARRTFEQALESNPQFPRIVTLLAGMDLEDGHLDAAERLIRPYFEQYPGLHSAQSLLTQWYLQKAMAAAKSGHLEAAEELCLAGVAELPDAAELHGLLGGYYLQRRDIPKALECMETCRRLRPGDPRAVMQLAETYMKLRRVDDARRVLSEARDWAVTHGEIDSVNHLDAILKSMAR